MPEKVPSIVEQDLLCGINHDDNNEGNDDDDATRQKDTSVVCNDKGNTTTSRAFVATIYATAYIRLSHSS